MLEAFRPGRARQSFPREAAGGTGSRAPASKNNCAAASQNERSSFEEEPQGWYCGRSCSLLDIVLGSQCHEASSSLCIVVFIAAPKGTALGGILLYCAPMAKRRQALLRSNLPRNSPGRLKSRPGGPGTPRLSFCKGTFGRPMPEKTLRRACLPGLLPALGRLMVLVVRLALQPHGTYPV